MMDPQLKARWVEALRSGNYKQCKHQLHSIDENGFCCFGVLADLIDPQGWRGERWNNQFDALNIEHAAELGIPDNMKARLECMNDGLYYKDDLLEEHDFYQIAGWIERNL